MYNNCFNPCYDPCAPLGSKTNPVVIDSFTNQGTYDLMQPVTSFISTLNPECKYWCFYLAIPQAIPYGDTLPIAYSEDSGTTLIDVFDRVGNYIRADRILPYDTRKCLLKCMFLRDPNHINVLSEVCPTHYLPPVTP